ncbi:MAG TPA: asparagine synthase-related protein [Steroidobacteraceae bacterium]|jgi:asparagine synthase (glutamine-hydrolysing)|nr:asparagine synthase-related protein [Steroidobacteraceae bacterium]
MFRYVALIWNVASPDLEVTASDFERRLRTTAPDWRSVLTRPGLCVLVAGRSQGFDAHLLCNDAGVVLGEVFARRGEINCDAPACDAKFNRLETHQAVSSQGRSLACQFWGNFVAFIVDSGEQAGGGRGARYVFKDPSGTLPCYFTERRGLHLVFSCLEDCRNMGLSFPINWEFVRARAAHGFLAMEIPSLSGVATVHRGQCAKFDAGGKFVSRSAYWHPSQFAHVSELITDSASAAKAMCATVRSCIHSLAGHHANVLAQISGGLDSSIVLGLLGDAPTRPNITCYTDYAPEAVCDERRWARYATARGAYRHVEWCRDPREVRYKDVPKLSPTVEPASYFTHWQRGPWDRQMATEYGATAVFTGEGGDSTLCATAYSFAADHCFRRHGLKAQTLRTALRVATRRDRTVWQVLAKAISREVFGAGHADERRRRSAFNRLVSPDLRKEAATKGDADIWSSGGRISEETRQRLGMLAFPPVFYDLSTSAQIVAPHAVAPLCAQPVVEICARIPIDIHFNGGRIRGLARKAFADVVPEPILRRQWKDRPSRFFEQVIQCNLPFLREHLLEGALARQGILDRAALELALRSGPSRSSAVSGEIFSHLDLELWIRDSA